MMKGPAMRLRKRLISLPLYAVMTGLVCFLPGGCGRVQKQGENLLVVNFHQGQPLRYQMTSTRRTTLATQDASTGKKQGSQQETIESLELVIVYKPVKVDPFGVTQIEGVCESVKVNRSSSSGKSQTTSDALENLKGKPFILELSPSGKIEDFKQLEKLLFDAGSTAFDNSRKEMRVKNPDMIYDFVALQWYLWDSIASVPNPSAGVRPGMTWKNTQLIAWPVPIPHPPCRITTFTLDSVKEENNQQKAVIKSTYQLSDKTVAGFPRPYEGSFMMRGLFGFLQNYQFQSLAGQGEQIFNLTTGIVESDTQEYDLVAKAAFLFPLGTSVPYLTVHQTLSIKLLENR
jgi:hypothetical protein